ncbi:MAG TPA: type II toxin-antitoxin system RelE/ParE family toxin [Thermoanaerobaculia bacterium]|nr:type II toxin-antitoxin system RelE/ParE family toxin [Thermoanaerobaculia bacterium]
MKHIYRPAAADDIDRAYARYEEERRGLGEEFLAEVTATAKLVVERPEAQTRRALVHRFPYGLFYRVLGDTVVFVACFHTSRNPALWARRR